MKVLCASLPGPGHTYPMLAVARALARRGHDVTLASSPQHDDDAAAAGCASVALPLHLGSSPDALDPYVDTEQMARGFAPVVAALAPDVAVVDLLTLGAALAAEMNGVPWASLLVHGLPSWAPDVLPFGLGQAPARFPLRWTDRWVKRAALRDVERARDDLNGVRARLGLPPTDRLDGQLSPTLQLVATLPSLELPRARYPAHAHVIGPALWDAAAAGEPVVPPSGGRPLVLIAPSTARADGGLARHATAAVEAIGARAIVTADPAVLPAPLPAGVLATPFTPHEAIVPACDAVVCNGGHGIVARALTHGVPVVVVPGHGDQRENGYRVERAGAGLRVLRPDRIAPALRRVLTEDRFRDAAGRLRAEAAAMDGPARAAELVEALVAGPVATL